MMTPVRGTAAHGNNSHTLTIADKRSPLCYGWPVFSPVLLSTLRHIVQCAPAYSIAPPVHPSPMNVDCGGQQVREKESKKKQS
ncbi:hypothetical protein E2C01_005884 [Portunus trituberculatus]|uniref:Uncharacterized protein n=1 Tax=Portunus trituberculatus TaxID=210409 RepID=A0A5B7CWN1_PORTR|nr:hypothetical protein [Portunus trituberculatus]